RPAMRGPPAAGLAPFLAPRPPRLTARYRLDRLSPGAALEAILRPAEAAGIAFDPDAARRLVADLRQVRVQQPDGSFAAKEGPYVEPVHLQVICRTAWLAGRPDPARIAAEDLEKLGGRRGQGVDAVLAGYYAERVAAAAAAGGVSERRVRDWFGKALITAAGARKPVLSGEEAEYGLNAACREVLDKAFLI